MNNLKAVCSLLSPLLPFYYIVCVFLIAVTSIVDYEWTIGEEGIANICDVVRHYEIGDDLDVMASFTGMFIFPLIMHSIYKIKKRCFIPPVFTTLLIIYWWWSFYGKLVYC